MWETGTAQIAIMLTGDNYEIDLLVRYASRELQDEVAADERQQALRSVIAGPIRSGWATPTAVWFPTVDT